MTKYLWMGFFLGMMMWSGWWLNYSIDKFIESGNWLWWLPILLNIFNVSFGVYLAVMQYVLIATQREMDRVLAKEPDRVEQWLRELREEDT